MIFYGENPRIFIYHAAIDMRCGFERLSFYVREEMGQYLIPGHLYLFMGKNRKRIKLIFFDGTGLVLVTKRLEKGRFLSISDLEKVESISADELKRLFDGAPICVQKYF